MKRIALLPGGFKPPHAGHYNMAKWLSINTGADKTIIFIGPKERDGITQEMSLELWKLYIQNDPKLEIRKAGVSPVRDVYDFIEQEAPIGSTVFLGMGEKDISDKRFANIPKFAEPRGITFKTELVPPQAGGVSGTEMRGFIRNDQETLFYNSLPDHVSEKDKQDAWSIVTKSQENPLNENLNEGIRDFIKTNKDKLQNLLKNFKEAWNDQKGSFKGYKGLVQKFLNDRSSLDIEEKAKLKQNTKDLFKTAGIIITFPVLGITGNVLLAFLVDKISKGQFSNLPSQMANVVGEDLYDPNDHVSDYMKSSEWKAGMPDGPKKDINPSYKYKRGGLYGKMYEEQIEGDKANKIFVMKSPYTPKGQKWDHIGFILNDGRLRDMSGHRGSDKSPETYKYEDTEELFQMPKDKNEAIEKGLYAEKPLPKEITIPNNIACDVSDPNKKAENCGSFVKIVLSNNGIETTKSNWMGDIYNSLNETVTDTDINLYPFKITDKTYDEEDNSLITTEYKFITPNNTYRVEFYSGEYNPEVKTFDLSFGVDKGELNTIDTFQMTGEGNARKIFKTILNITKDFINKEDVNKIVVDGTDEKRKRIYKTIFSSTPPEISDKIELKEAILNETVTDTDIICDNCGWTWAIVDGGDDLYNCHTCGHDNTPNTMNEQKLFSKNWWKDIINEILLSEGGAAGHMAHPFDLPNVTSGRDLVNVFEQAADSLQTNPGAVKIDGVNSSIRLIDVGGTKQFAMDRGSKKELDIKGITKADLEDRFSQGHGMIKVGGEVLDMFNEALPTIQGDLKKLGALDDPSILFNMEYVAGKTNVQDYGSNFIAIHGLNKVKMEEVPGRMYRGKPLVKRYSQEFNYDKNALQSLLNNLAPIAKKRGFEVYGSVPTEMTTKPNFRSSLSKRYTVETNEGAQVKPLGQWLEGMDNIPVSDFIFMNVGSGKKKVGAVSKQVYLAILKGGNVDELFEDQDDKQKAINGFATYLGTEKLGDEVLKVLNSPMGSVENHEGVVVRDEKIAKIPFKITGKFILGGMVSDF